MAKTWDELNKEVGGVTPKPDVSAGYATPKTWADYNAMYADYQEPKPEVAPAPPAKQSFAERNFENQIGPNDVSTNPYIGGITAGAGGGSPFDFHIVTPKFKVTDGEKGLVVAGKTVFNTISTVAQSAFNSLNDYFDFRQKTYKENKAITGGNMFNMTPEQKALYQQNVQKQFAPALATEARTAGSVASIAFAPISAELTAAESSGIPVVSQVAGAVNRFFGKVGEGGAWVGNKVIDVLPVSEQSKTVLREPIGELAALAAQLLVAKGMEHGVSEFAKGKREVVNVNPNAEGGFTSSIGREATPTARVFGLADTSMKIAVAPISETVRRMGDAFKAKIAEKKAMGLDPNNPDIAKQIVNEVVKEVPAKVAGTMTIIKTDSEGNVLSTAGKTGETPKPVGVEDVIHAISQRESSGSYDAVGKPNSKGETAYGKYQVMDYNIPKWSKEILGHSITVDEFKSNPQLQERIARGKITQLWNKYGNAEDVASVWFTGKPYTETKGTKLKDVNGTEVDNYVKDIVELAGGKGGDVRTLGTVENPLRVQTDQKLVLQNFIKGQEDINYKVFPDLGTTQKGEPITARFEWNYKTQEGTMLVTKSTVAADLAHELGHYFDRKLSADIGIRMSDMIPDYRNNSQELNATLASYAVDKLGGTATKAKIDNTVKASVKTFDSEVRALARGEKRGYSEKFAEAFRIVLTNPQRAARIAPEFTDFVKYAVGKEGIIKERAKKVVAVTEGVKKVKTERNTIEDYVRNKKAPKFRVEGEASPKVDSKIFRKGEPTLQEGGDTNYVARERFDIPNLKKISFGGSDRDVYDLGDYVLKIAKTSRGLSQNAASADYYAEDAGLIPKTLEVGDNYIVKEKVNPPDANVKEMVKELHKYSILDLPPNGYKDQEGFLKVLEKHGFPANDLANYNPLWGDLQVIRNWGTKDGKPIHLDEGTLNGDLVRNDTVKGKNMSDPEFRDIYFKSKAARQEFGDVGGKTKYRVAEDSSVSNVPKGLKPLAEEARKYKTAKDFVDAIENDKGGIGSGVDYSPGKRLVETGINDTPLTDFGFKPNDKVTVYRGVDNASQKEIVAGDYVATSYDLAKSYTGGEVISKEVPASSVRLSSGDGITAEDFKNGFENTHLEGVYNPTAPIPSSKLADFYDQVMGEGKFRVKDDFKNATGIEISTKQESEIKALNRKIFGDDNVKFVEQILTPEGQKALGAYKEDMIKILDGKADAKETFYHEAVHKYMDTILDMNEQVDLLRAGKAKYKTEDLHQVEENLAEDFINYAKSREGVTGTIKLIFDKIIARVNKYFGNEDQIQSFYQSILDGQKSNGQFVDAKPSSGGVILDGAPKEAKLPKPFKGEGITTEAFNAEKINAPADVLHFLDSVTKKNDNFGEDRRSVTLDEMKQFSYKYLGDEKLYKTVPAEIRANIGKMKAAEQTMVDMATELQTDLKNTDLSVASKTEMDRLIRNLTQLEQVTAAFSGARTEASHLFASLKSEVTPGENQIMRELFTEMKKQGLDTAGIDQFFRDKEKAKKVLYETRGQAIVGTWYSFLLSGPTTFIKNAVSTAGSVMAETMSTALRNPAEALRAIPNLMHGLLDGMGMAKEVAMGQRKGAAEIARGSKFTDNEKIPYKFKPIESSIPGVETLTGALASTFNSMKIVGRLLAASDTVFNEGLRQMELGSLKSSMPSTAELTKLAEQKAKAEGFKGAEAEAKVKEYVDNPEVLLGDLANSFALRGTYNSDPQGILGAISRGVSEATRSKPALKFLAPFTKVVANVVSRAVDYTPYGYTRMMTGEGLLGGKLSELLGGEKTERLTKRQTAQQVARATVGTLAMVYAYYLATQQRLSGDGPRDINKKNQLLDTGWRPNSIKMGDTWVPYSNLGPLGLPLALAANAHEATYYDEVKQDDWESRVAAGLSGSLSTIFSMSFLSGINNLMDIAKSDDPKKMQKFVGSTVSGLVAPNFVKQVARYFDPTVYDTSSVSEQLMSDLKVTGSLHPRLNVFGEEVKGDRLTALSPSQERNDPVMKFLADNKLWVSVAGKATQIALDRKEQRSMTSDEYFRYIKESGPLIKAQIARQMVAISRLKSREDQQKQINDIVDNVRTRVKQNIIRDARKAIRKNQ